MLAASVLIQGTLVVSGPLVVRLVGVESRGEIAVVFAVASFVGQLGALGVPAAFAFFVSARGVSARAMILRFGARYAIQVTFMAGLAAVTMLALTRRVELTDRGFAIAMAGGGAAILLLVVLVYGCFQGEQRFVALSRLQAIPGAFYATALVVLLLVGLPSVPVVLVCFFAGWALVVVIGTTLLLRRPRHPVSPRGVDEQVDIGRRELRSYALRATTTATAVVDNLNLDQILIAILLTNQDLGLYVIGYAFESAPVLALVAVASVLTPRVAADRSGGRRLGWRWLGASAALGVVIVMALQLVIEPVTLLAFGSEAEDAVSVGRILVVAGLILGLRRVTAAILLGLEHPGRATVAELVGLMTLLATLPIFASSWGVHGAAWALLTAGCTVLVLQVLALGRLPVPGASSGSSPGAGSTVVSW